MRVVELVNVSKSYAGERILETIDLTIEEGEIVGVLGPSGAGKTTLVKIILGHLASDSGSSQVFGTDSLRLSDQEYRKIGSVLDESGLFDRLSCLQNLEVYRKIYGMNKTQVQEVLSRVGLAENQNTVVNNLSKGMKQRVVIARAIMHKPKLLFLDEPTSGLDPATARLIHQLILELKNEGTTVLLVTHNMQEAAELCDRVAFLVDGRFAAFDTPKKICASQDQLHKIEIRTADNKEYSYVNEKSNYSKIEAIFKDNEVQSIHSSEPTLGQVFLSLTGKELV